MSTRWQRGSGPNLEREKLKKQEDPTTTDWLTEPTIEMYYSKTNY